MLKKEGPRMAHSINIFGSINDVHINIVQSAITLLENDPELLLEITIDSNGGDPDAAKVIYDSLENFRNRATTISNGDCMSSAVLIFLAADIRLAGKKVNFMIHPTSWTLWGAYSFLRTYKSLNNNGDLILTLAEVYTLQSLLNTATTRLNEIEDYTDEIFRTRAKLTKKQFHDRRSVNTDQKFTPEESLQMGISTKLI